MILTKYRPFLQRKSKIINNGVSISKLFQVIIAREKKTDLRQFVSDLRVLGNKYLLRNDIVNAFATYCTKYEKPEQFHQSSHLSKLIYYVQEIILEDDSLCILLRPKIASIEIVRLGDDLTVQQMTVQELLDVRGRSLRQPLSPPRRRHP